VSTQNILEKLGSIESTPLTQLQRILVVTDGTLTEILEAAFLERIRLIKISQETVSSTASDSLLVPAPGETFLRREYFSKDRNRTKTTSTRNP
jgi:chorismate-pyruvate lyase